MTEIITGKVIETVTATMICFPYKLFKAIRKGKAVIHFIYSLRLLYTYGLRFSLKVIFIIKND